MFATGERWRVAARTAPRVISGGHVEAREVAKAANFVPRLTAGLLLLAALVAFANIGWAAASVADAPRPGLADPAAPDAGLVMTAGDGEERPCGAPGALSGTTRCLTSQCAPGGIPAAAMAVPSPRSGADAHAAVSDSPPRGVTPVLDPPPPRPSA